MQRTVWFSSQFVVTPKMTSFKCVCFLLEFKLVNPVKGIVVAFCCLSSAIAWAHPVLQQENAGGEDGASVSFVKHVAPIIVAKCGKCHVASSKGKYGIASYDALMASDSISPNDPTDSSFIEVIESGEMPKGGLKVSDEELATLKKWISEGAKYDGDNKTKPLMEPRTGNSRQGGGRGRKGLGGSRLQAVEQNPQDVGDEGVAWYVTWETGLAEAKRSNRPIFFMSAAAQCSGVSGVF